MSAPHNTIDLSDLGGRKSAYRSRGRWLRTLLASTAALSLGVQDVAWATCADGSTFPAGGFVVGSAQLPIASNWSPNVFTAPQGSLFIPDASVNERNDSAQPLTGGGHNWVFDQGSTLCKQTDTGPGGAVATGWAIPPILSPDCIILPVISRGVLGDIPFQGDAITPTCDPTKLSAPGAPNPANTYLNQLGCSISRGVATSPQTASSFLFVTGIKSGLFSVRLDNAANPTVGGESGKVVGLTDFYSAITGNQPLTSAAVSKDGRLAIATSLRRLQAVFACLNPLGDPGDPSKPINPNFVVPSASSVHCMQVGNNNLLADETTAVGPDNQPYFAGQRSGGGGFVNGFGNPPGGTSKNAWPNCIWQAGGSSLSLADAFAHNRQNGCGNAASNSALVSPSISQTSILASHGSYMYLGTNLGPVVQIKVTTNPISGLSSYTLRTYVTGLSFVSSVGVADDLGSLMVFSTPFTAGMAPGVWTKLPVCEDMVP
jgi:hypothetical protein